jgi:hypothetical protein
MENYEFLMKHQFNGYLKDEKRLFAYPHVSFIFGIRDIDDGYIFDMNDRGHLHLMPIHLNRQSTLEFFKQFIAHLGTRSDLFSSNYDLEKDFEAFYQVNSFPFCKTRTETSVEVYSGKKLHLPQTVTENLAESSQTVTQNLPTPSQTIIDNLTRPSLTVTENLATLSQAVITTPSQTVI